MDIKMIPPEDYCQVHQLRDYCFPNKYIGARREDFQYWIEHSITLGAYDAQKVVGQLLILPLNITVHGKSYAMGGIGFVATYPEYRQQGIIKKLMTAALLKMRENGQSVSVLAPFSVSFYRYFGWELFFEKLHYSIPQMLFPNFGKQLDVIKRMSFECQDNGLYRDIKDFHNAQALTRNGGMLRNNAWWQRIERRMPDSHLAAYYNSDNVAGYIRYMIHNEIFEIHDFIAENLLAEQAIWRFVTSHATSVTSIKGITSSDHHFGFHFKEPQFKREVVQDVMIRIVDVLSFMQQYSWQEMQEPLYVRIEDSFCAWNEHIFKINKDGNVSIVETNSIPAMHMLALPINLFSAMMIGYLSVSEAVEYAHKQPTKELVERWQLAIPTEKPAFYEYF